MPAQPLSDRQILGIPRPHKLRIRPRRRLHDDLPSHALHATPARRPVPAESLRAAGTARGPRPAANALDGPSAERTIRYELSVTRRRRKRSEQTERPAHQTLRAFRYAPASRDARNKPSAQRTKRYELSVTRRRRKRSEQTERPAHQTLRALPASRLRRKRSEQTERPAHQTLRALPASRLRPHVRQAPLPAPPRPPGNRGRRFDPTPLPVDESANADATARATTARLHRFPR